MTPLFNPHPYDLRPSSLTEMELDVVRPSQVHRDQITLKLIVPRKTLPDGLYVPYVEPWDETERILTTGYDNGRNGRWLIKRAMGVIVDVSEVTDRAAGPAPPGPTIDRPWNEVVDPVEITLVVMGQTYLRHPFNLYDLPESWLINYNGLDDNILSPGKYVSVFVK